MRVVVIFLFFWGVVGCGALTDDGDRLGSRDEDASVGTEEGTSDSLGTDQSSDQSNGTAVERSTESGGSEQNSNDIVNRSTESGDATSTASNATDDPPTDSGSTDNIHTDTTQNTDVATGEDTSSSSGTIENPTDTSPTASTTENETTSGSTGATDSIVQIPTDAAEPNDAGQDTEIPTDTATDTVSETDTTMATDTALETDTAMATDTAVATDTAIPCNTIDEPENGWTETSNGNQAGSIATHHCNVDYALVGSTSQECLPSGTWSDDTPSCVLVDGCTPNPCVNGNCIDGIESYTCNCTGHWDGDHCDVCETGYYGPDCDTYCSATTTCNGNGECNADGVCACTGNFDGAACDECDANYYGANCQTYCNASTTCSNHGTCTTSGTCSCSGNWDGDACDTCDTNYYGSNCQTYCSADTTCSGNGTCTTSGTCSCSGNWTGDACDECDTNYYGSSCQTYCEASTTCSGHGTCTTSGTCSCADNWDGDACDACDTNYYGNNCQTYCEASTTCNGHGTCTTSGTCSCSGNWDGASCNSCDTNYYGPDCQTYCNASTTCNGKGTCNADGNCACSGLWDGPDCEGCAPGWILNGNTCEPYCDHRLCWQVPPTEQERCFNDVGEVITCPGFPCPDNGSSAFCGQDAQYPEPDRTLTAITQSGVELVNDSFTSLTWQVLPRTYTTWTEAVSYCENELNANGYGGYTSGWRLPSIRELLTIVDYSRQPSINNDYYTQYYTNHHWSSTETAKVADQAWRVYFFSGWIDGADKTTDSYYARCVRGNYPIEDAPERFDMSEEVGDTLVHDQATGLMWQHEYDDNEWNDALRMCEGSYYGGYSDWRLPNINELLSLTNFDAPPGQPASDMPGTPNCEADYTSCCFWSSTTRITLPGYDHTHAYLVCFYEGRSTMEYKTAARQFRCVRDDD